MKTTGDNMKNQLLRSGAAAGLALMWLAVGTSLCLIACGGGSSSPPPAPPLQMPGFTVTGSMQTARSGHTATPLANGKVLITGGDNFGNSLATAELFDPTSGNFTLTGSMGTARENHGAVVLLSGKVLILGGDRCTHGVGCVGGLATAELFDPATGGFTATGSMAIARSSPTATRLADGTVLATGGGDSSAELFDPATGTFTFTGFMSVPRVSPTATRLQNGVVLFAGGGEPFIGNLGTAELFDPVGGTFSDTGGMATARQEHTAILLSNGKVLVAGGDGDAGTLASAELFDSVAGRFSAAGNMTTARVNHTATLRNDGRVLIVGGQIDSQTGPNVLASAELFDPATGQFTAVPSMKSARTQHAAVLLSNGAVLVIGGSDINGRPLLSAEIFQ